MDGWFDLHLHGAFGVDVVTADAAALDRLAARLGQRGYAAFLPTLVPLAADALDAAVDRLAEWIDGRREGDGRGAVPLGIHFEGPLVSPQRAGALHPDRFVDGRAPDRLRRLLDRVIGAPGRTMVTLAPEIPGGLEAARELAARGVLVSIGHTDATWAELEAAVDAGARHMTHFCNAMRPLHHREPGPVGFGLRCPEVSVDLIADLHHLHPRTIELVARARGGRGVALISDAMPAAGLPDGDYEVWGETLRVHEGEARNAAGALAGSVALLDECVVNATALDAGPDFDARAAASSVPLAILRGANARGGHPSS